MIRLVLFGLLSFVAFAAQSVDGHVTNAITGADVPGVTVRLIAGPDSPLDPFEATTDPHGRFHFDNIPDGVYRADYVAKGYRRTARDTQDRRSVVVSPAAPVRLEVLLQPASQISGRVTDAEGRAVPKAAVWVLGENIVCSQPRCFAPIQRVEADSKGEYHIENLDIAGTWIVSASPPPDWPAPKTDPDSERLTWVETFYPNVADPSVAQKITPRAGRDLFNLDIKIGTAPARKLTERVLNPDGKPLSGADVVLGNGLGPSLHAASRAEGVFDFASVPAGEYRLEASLHADKTDIWADRLLTVGRRDVEGIDLRLAAPFTLPARFVWLAPDGTPSRGLTPDALHPALDHDAGEIRLVDVKPHMGFREEDPNGAPIFTDVYPGDYNIIVFEPVPAPFYLDSIVLGDRDAMASRIAIPSPAQPLTFTFKSDGGTVRGSIENCGGAHVLLVPRDPALFGPAFISTTTCDAHGQYQLTTVRPADYYAMAIAADDDQRWQEAATKEQVLKQAVRVTVKANQFLSVDLRVIRWP